MSFTRVRRMLPVRWYYNWCRLVCRITSMLVFRKRVWGATNLPPDFVRGGYIILSNHQSHFDPPMVGDVFYEPVTFLARDSLFGTGREDTTSGLINLVMRLFGAFITSVGGVPIARVGVDRRMFDLIDEAFAVDLPVMVFAEGTRSRTGEVQPFKRGVELMTRRFPVPILPVAIDGTFQTWPTGCPPWKMRPRELHLVIGKPIDAREYESWPRAELATRLQAIVGDLHAEARRRRIASIGQARYDVETKWAKDYVARRDARKAAKRAAAGAGAGAEDE